jgi:hypothetical protein
MKIGFARKAILYIKWLYKNSDYVINIVLFEKWLCKEN